ncbi:hypothetical protein [Archangium sp.]|uniref:hypothetical protein n=1 Tax=Archangium sp. TaxID=1872627 RepID=UPI00389A1D5C
MARLLAVIALCLLITGFFHPMPPLLIALLTLFMIFGGLGLVLEAIGGTIRWVGQKSLGEERWSLVERRLTKELLLCVLGYGFGAWLVWGLALKLRREFFPETTLYDAVTFVIAWVAVLGIVGAPIALFMSGFMRGLKGEERPSASKQNPTQGV